MGDNKYKANDYKNSGLSKVNYLKLHPEEASSGSSSSSGSSGNLTANASPIEAKPGHYVSADASKIAGGLSNEALQYILSQDFGTELTSGEITKLNSKWLNANKANTDTKGRLNTYGLPDDAFKITRPFLVPGTPEYKAAMENLSTAYFDVMQQQLNASTEQEKAVADYNWNTLKKNAESSLGTTLSDNAYQAWNQIQALKDNYAQRNIENSGLQGESVDTYLAAIRRADEQARKSDETDATKNEAAYYSNYATPEQIKALIASDPAKAQSYGLVPSEQTRTAMSFANMKRLYPNMSDDEINRNIATTLDTNGNYRSALYQRYMTGSSVGINSGQEDTANTVLDQYGNKVYAPVKPNDTGYLDIQAAKQKYQDINTPLANQYADFQDRLKLGSIAPAANENINLFNKVDPKAKTETIKPAIAQPINKATAPGAILPLSL